MLDLLICLDRSIFLLFNSAISNPIFDYFFTYITHRNSWILPGIIAAVFFIIKEKKHALIVLFLIIVTASISDPLCVRVLKPLFHRFRPCHPAYFIEGQHIFLTGGHFLLGFKKSLSFPSAHAMNMFAGATLLTLLYPKRAVWFFSIAVPVAFSRIYVGVHYPSDFVVGAIAGSGIGFLVFYGYQYIMKYIRVKTQKTEQDS